MDFSETAKTGLSDGSLSSSSSSELFSWVVAPLLYCLTMLQVFWIANSVHSLPGCKTFSKDVKKKVEIIHEDKVTTITKVPIWMYARTLEGNKQIPGWFKTKFYFMVLKQEFLLSAIHKNLSCLNYFKVFLPNYENLPNRDSSNSRLVEIPVLRNHKWSNNLLEESHIPRTNLP